MADQDEGLPEWLVFQLVSNSIVYFVCLLILGVGFWKVIVITGIAILSLLMDFCRKYVCAVGGALLTAVLLGWVGIDLGHWVSRLSGLPSP